METLQQKIGHQFNDPSLLEEALTHSSYAFENTANHNERLEFLGDAILNACTTIMLHERFRLLREGQLSHLRSRLVNTDTLAAVGASLGLAEALKVGNGVESRGGRTLTSLLADATEAVIGAVYLDSDFETARALINDWLAERMEALANSDDREVGWLDPRGRLQHQVQKSHGQPPTYVNVRTVGPDHAPTFTVEVRIGQVVLGVGEGASKRTAARAAAVNALRSSEEE